MDTVFWLGKRRRQHTLPLMASPFLQHQNSAKRRHMDDDGGQSTKASDGTEGAYGLNRGELGELAVRVAQMVSIHDTQIRELQA